MTTHFDPLDSPLSILPRETVQAWLIEALQAEQSLATGTQIVTANYAQGDGNRAVTYTQADRLMLKARIAELSAFLQIGRPGRRGPMKVIF